MAVLTATPVNTVTSVNPNTQSNLSLAVAFATSTPGELQVIQIAALATGTAVNPNVATPAGWIKVTEQFSGTGTPASLAGIYYRVYQAGDGSSVTFTWTNQGQMVAGCTSFAVGSFDTTSPISYFTSLSKTGANTSYTISGATTKTGCLIYGAANKTGTAWSALPAGDNPLINIVQAGNVAMLAGYQPPDTPSGSAYTKAMVGASTSIGVMWAFVVTSSSGGITPPADTSGIQELTGLGNVTSNVSQSNSITCAKPTNVADGDLLLARVTAQTANNGQIVESGTSAWTPIGPAIPPTSLRPQRMFVLPVTSAAALTATQWTWVYGATGRMNVQINRITGIDLASIVDSEGAWSNGQASATTSFDIPGFSSNDINNFLVVHLHTTNTAAQGNLVYTVPSGFAETSRTDSVASGTASSDTSIGLSRLTTVAGAQAACHIELVSAIAAGGGVMVALNVRPNTIDRTPADVVGISDSFTASMIGANVKTNLETVAITDSFTTKFDHVQVFADPIGISDEGQISPLTKWIGSSPSYIAHRDGFSTTHGEFTVAGFNALKARNPRAAWNIDVWKTTDNEWVASHDGTTGRVLSGPNLDITTSTWVGIQPKTTLVGGNPVARIDDLVAVANPDTVFFVDNKQAQNIPAFLAKLASLGLTPQNTVLKTFGGTSNTNVVAQRDAGYQMWLYAFDADMPTLAVNYSIDSTAWIGFDYNGLQANWDTIVSYGHPVSAHVLTNSAAKASADTKVAASGGRNFAYMTTVMTAVVAPDVTNDPVNITDSLTTTFTAGSVVSDSNVRGAVVNGIVIQTTTTTVAISLPGCQVGDPLRVFGTFNAMANQIVPSLPAGWTFAVAPTSQGTAGFFVAERTGGAQVGDSGGVLNLGIASSLAGNLVYVSLAMNQTKQSSWNLISTVGTRPVSQVTTTAPSVGSANGENIVVFFGKQTNQAIFTPPAGCVEIASIAPPGAASSNIWVGSYQGPAAPQTMTYNTSSANGAAQQYTTNPVLGPATAPILRGRIVAGTETAPPILRGMIIAGTEVTPPTLREMD